MIDPERRHQTAVKDVVDGCGSEDTLEDFGIDYDGPLPEEQLHTVDVPETASTSMPREVLERFMSGAGGGAVSIEEAVTEYITKRNCLVTYLEQAS